MSIDAMTGVSGLSTGTVAASATAQSLDSEAFMALLVAQLRYHDPSSPMDTSEMMSQQTQLASVEKLTELSTVLQEQFALSMRMAATGLVGQEVSYTDENGEVVTGTATSVSFAGAVPTVAVGDTDIPLDAIMAVRSTGA